MNYDVDFSVPQRHRVRFTNDLAGRDFEVLTELMVANDDVVAPPKVLLVIDHGVAETSLTSQLVSRLANSKQIKLMDCGSVFPNHPKSGPVPKRATSPAYFMQGGEICKNDTNDVEKILGLINRFELDRRSFVVAVGGGALLDAVGFAAATAHRGVRLIRVPTTTLGSSRLRRGRQKRHQLLQQKELAGHFCGTMGCHQ